MYKCPYTVKIRVSERKTLIYVFGSKDAADRFAFDCGFNNDVSKNTCDIETTINIIEDLFKKYKN